MPRKQHKYHFLYKTTNIINEKFYVGMHSTSDINDGYLGSGKRLRYAINKYGKENFKMERLTFFETRQLLVNAETDIVNEDLLKDPLCMNLMTGGKGGNAGYSKEQYRKWARLGGYKTYELIEKDPELKKKFILRVTKIAKMTYESGKFKRYNPSQPWIYCTQ